VSADVRIRRMRHAAMSAWRRFLRTRKLPAYWPELAMLDPEDRAFVKGVLRDRCVWLASAPRSTVDGRRFR
jgi:uncharacterized protein YfaQ (DUF2300 family)